MIKELEALHAHALVAYNQANGAYQDATNAAHKANESREAAGEVVQTLYEKIVEAREKEADDERA